MTILDSEYFCWQMVDRIKVLPRTDREYPLYRRLCSRKNTLFYAVFVLNHQSISQLKYYICLSWVDPWASLTDLPEIMIASSRNRSMRSRREPPALRPVQYRSSWTYRLPSTNWR